MGDDERREVARRLRSLDDDMCHVRRAYDDDGVTTACDEQSDYYQIYDAVFGSIPPEFMIPYDYKEFHDRLADLIEPTEKVSHVQTRVKRATQRETYTTKTCCECGYEFGMERHREYPFDVVLDEIELPSYCPGCGGRVVGP